MAFETFTRYNLATGEVLSVIQVEATYIADQIQAGQGFVIGEVDGATHYIVVGVPTARPSSSAAYSGNDPLDNDGADTGTITPIDPAAVVTVYGIGANGAEYLLETYDPWGADDTLEFTSTLEADYIVRIRNFPDLDLEIPITVRA